MGGAAVGQTCLYGLCGMVWIWTGLRYGLVECWNVRKAGGLHGVVWVALRVGWTLECPRGRDYFTVWYGWRYCLAERGSVRKAGGLPFWFTLSRCLITAMAGRGSERVPTLAVPDCCLYCVLRSRIAFMASASLLLGYSSGDGVHVLLG